MSLHDLKMHDRRMHVLCFKLSKCLLLLINKLHLHYYITVILVIIIIIYYYYY